MEIIVNVPSQVEDHLKAYAASIFYDTSPYALSGAILIALIDKLDENCLIDKKEVARGVTENSKPVELAPPKHVIATINSLPITESSEKPKALKTIIDPKDLKTPSEKFNTEVSNTWLVWGWCMASSLNLVTLESGARKFHSFDIKDVIQGVIQRKGVRVKDTTAYSALDVLTKRQWLTYDENKKLYALTQVAQKWVLTPKNQTDLIKNNFLDPIEHPTGK